MANGLELPCIAMLVSYNCQTHRLTLLTPPPLPRKIFPHDFTSVAKIRQHSTLEKIWVILKVLVRWKWPGSNSIKNKRIFAFFRGFSTYFFSNFFGVFPHKIVSIWYLKVLKCEIFDRSDFPDFYTIKSLRVGDFGVKIKNLLKNI